MLNLKQKRRRWISLGSINKMEKSGPL
jgi:hypothetical protein